MKNIRTLLIAVSALAIINVAHAQTTPYPNAVYSTDPMIQKRQDDSIAKKEYKARKKAAKLEMKAEKKDAKSDLKAEKAESTEIRNNAMAADPISKKP